MKKYNLSRRKNIAISLLAFCLIISGNLGLFFESGWHETTGEVVSFRSEVVNKKTQYPTRVYYRVDNNYLEQEIILGEAIGIGSKIQLKYNSIHPIEIRLRNDIMLWAFWGEVILGVIMVFGLIFKSLRFKNRQDNYKQRIAKITPKRERS